MQLPIQQLDAHLGKTLAPLYLVHGDEALLTIEAVDAIRNAARRQGATEREVLQLDARSDWSQLTRQSASMSLFGDRRLLEIRIPSGKPGVTGAATLQRFANSVTEAPDDSQIAVVLLPQVEYKTRSADWFTALTRAAVSIEVPTIERTRLPEWLAQRLKRRGQSAPADALEFIADRVEGNLLAAHQEIEKLALLYPAGPLTLEQVRDAVLNVARFGVHQLSEALLAGKLARAQHVLDGLKAEGEALPLIVWVVAEDVRTVLRFAQYSAAGRHSSTFRNELRLWGPREGMVQQAARRASIPALSQAVLTLAQVDKASKGLTHDTGAMDPWTLLSTSFAAFAGK